ncbi:MAG: response regulator [FCB group bacterium]|jgi:two-component system chemotaxis response regulator CheY
MKFLVVDDSPIMRRIVINALGACGFKSFVEAEDGSKAIGILKGDKIDFVITDWNMPVMNGLDLTTAIRSDESLNKTPILMVTTRVAKEDIINALKAKVNNYLIKPFTPIMLKEKIDSIVGPILDPFI